MCIRDSARRALSMPTCEGGLWRNTVVSPSARAASSVRIMIARRSTPCGRSRVSWSSPRLGLLVRRAPDSIEPPAHTVAMRPTEIQITNPDWVDSCLLYSSPVSYTHLRAHETPEHLV